MKTKKPIWCLLFIVSALGVYAQRYVAIDYHKDSDHYVIDNRVNVRSAPNISGEKLFQLNAGDKVRILEWNEDGEWLWAEGYYAPWYKISCAKGTGYICGRYVSCKEAVGDLDNDGEDEVFACLCVSESKGAPISGNFRYMSSFYNINTHHVLIKDSQVKNIDLEKLYLEEFDENKISRDTFYSIWECEYLTPEVSFLVARSGSKDEEDGWYTKRYFYFTDGTLKYLTTLSDVESKMHYGFVEYFEFSNRNTITVMHISKSRENGTPSVSERESGGYLWNGKDFIDTGGQ